MKRLFDVVASSMALLVLLPVFFIVAIVIRIKLGKPVLFSQPRPGLYGRLFNLYKFRTMTDDVDKNGRLLPDAERLVPLGRLLRSLSVDELPTLWNVLIGDMSLVGPRPLLAEYLELYSKAQARRHEVLPGITGWAQVNGRNAICWEKKFELDVWYVDNWSLRLDGKILLMTLKKVLRKEGISHPNQDTMPRFRGTD